MGGYVGNPPDTTAQNYDERYAPITRGRKNLLINGGMQVWQRGTSISVPSGINTYTADRWYCSSTGGTTTVTRGSSNYTDLPYSLRMQAGTGVTAMNGSQRIESANAALFAGKTITLKFEVYAAETGVFTLETAYPTTTADDFSAQTVDYTESGISLSVGWNVFTRTFTTAAGCSRGMRLTLAFGAAVNYVRSLSRVQLEIGSEATDIELRTYGEELALCQRYYQTGYVTCYGYSPSAGGGIYETVGLPVQPRAAATLTGAWAYYSNTSGGALTQVGASQIRGNVVVTAAGVGNAGCSFTVDAEL